MQLEADFKTAEASTYPRLHVIREAQVGSGDRSSCDLKGR